MPHKTKTNDPDESSLFLKGGEFKRDAGEANDRTPAESALTNTDWADLPPKEQEKAAAR